MTRTALAALVAASLATPALGAQSICEYDLAPGAAPLPVPEAVMDVERVRAALREMPQEEADQGAFAALTVMFAQNGRVEDVEVFLRPGVTGDARALRQTVRGAMASQAYGPPGRTAVMTLVRGEDAGVHLVPVQQECMPRLLNASTVSQEIERGFQRWADHQMNNSGRELFDTNGMLRFRVDERGRIGRVRVVRRTNAPEIDMIFRRGLERAVFEPGSVYGIPIGRWLQQPTGVFVGR